jgi:hypothetical protein
VPSLKQQYHEYILQRIESYKNTLSRRELLQLGNDAVAEMEAAGDQFLLTEVLLTDWVDRLIHKRLRLQPYARWSKQFRQLRSAQQEPTHWGIDRRNPVTWLLPRLEPGDRALVIGADAASLAFLLAAHDVEVVFTDSDMTFVDQIESRVAEEALGHYCSTYVSPAGHLDPGLPTRVQIVALDTATLESQSATARRMLVEQLMERTDNGGVHLILPSAEALTPEAFLSLYGEWSREELPRERRRPAKSMGLLLGKPPSTAESGDPVRSRDVPA